jgi:ABC-type Fe3+/spermidine/putrescine transport system ATPase subunit
MTLADRIVVMADGSVQQIGSPDELYHSPANRFVANSSAKATSWRGKSLRRVQAVIASPGARRHDQVACANTRNVGTRIELV